mmetsp:Transcript_23121/g.45685  ORF Transcript_23121/g.45685 Transcript_23121/m.45685 type:complete len:756 (-) Transcript_23121:170-2437(-)
MMSLPAKLFAKTPLLKVVNFNSNKLISLPHMLFSAVSQPLQFVDFANNLLTQLPRDIFQSVRINKLAVYGRNTALCQIASIHGTCTCKRFPINTTIMWNETSIVAPTSSVLFGYNVQNTKVSFDLSRRGYNNANLQFELTKLLNNLSECETVSSLNISGNKVTRIDLDSFANFSQSLEELDASHNLVSDVSPSLLFGKLRWLSLAHNELTSFNQGTSLAAGATFDFECLEDGGGFLNKMTNLEEADLSFNRISLAWTRKPFCRCRKLVSLDLSNNAVQRVPPGLFSTQSQLRSLSLKNNFIRGLDTKTFFFTSELDLKHLDLRNNTNLTCETTVISSNAKMATGDCFSFCFAFPDVTRIEYGLSPGNCLRYYSKGFRLDLEPASLACSFVVQDPFQGTTSDAVLKSCRPFHAEETKVRLARFFATDSRRLTLIVLGKSTDDCTWFSVSISSPTAKSPPNVCNAVTSSRALINAWESYCQQNSNAGPQKCADLCCLYQYFDKYSDPSQNLFFAGGALLGVAILAGAASKKQTGSSVALKLFAKIVLGLMDFSTDLLFLAKCFSSAVYLDLYHQVRAVALVFLVLPWLVNVAFVYTVITRASNNPTSRQALTNNWTLSAIVCMLSTFHTEILNVFSCGFLGKASFSIDLQCAGILNYSGLITNVLEDLPQLVIQSFVLSSSGELLFSSSGVGIMISCLSLLNGLLSRTLQCTMMKKNEKLAGETSPGPGRSSDSEVELGDIGKGGNIELVHESSDSM